MVRQITRQDLKNFRHLKKEIEMLDRQIKTLGYDTVSDTVKGSSKEFPYTEHIITITGLDKRGHADKVRRLQHKLDRRKADLQEQLADIDACISGIDDCILRQVVSLRFVEGLSWGQVAASIGGGNSADGVRMMCNRFFSKT